jgi:hypothetical protein
MPDLLAWLRAFRWRRADVVRRAMFAARRAQIAATFAATDRRIETTNHNLREIEARLDLLERQADPRGLRHDG